MTERIGALGHVLNAAVTVVSRGRLGVGVNPTFTKLDRKHTKRTWQDGGTQLIFDQKKFRVVPKYRTFKRSGPVTMFSSRSSEGDNWNIRTSQPRGRGAFLEGTGKSLDQHIYSGDELL